MEQSPTKAASSPKMAPAASKQQRWLMWHISLMGRYFMGTLALKWELALKRQSHPWQDRQETLSSKHGQSVPSWGGKCAHTKGSPKNFATRNLTSPHNWLTLTLTGTAYSDRRKACRPSSSRRPCWSMFGKRSCPARWQRGLKSNLRCDWEFSHVIETISFNIEMHCIV